MLGLPLSTYIFGYCILGYLLLGYLLPYSVPFFSFADLTPRKYAYSIPQGAYNP